ncbi:MAG: hypothetical protein ACLQVA_06390 [Candidatus Brocadiia bacterium]
MQVWHQHLPAEVCERLASAQRQGGFGRGSFFLSRSRRWPFWMGLIVLAVAGVCLAMAVSMRHDPTLSQWWYCLIPAALGLLGVTYGLVALAEFVRSRRAELQPFLLVTPGNLVECRGSHRPLAVHRLVDATEFHKVEQFNRTRWTGIAYDFVFGGTKESARIVLKDRQQIAALDEVLSLAQAKGRGQPLPDWPGAREPDLQIPAPDSPPRKSFLDQVLDPASPLWIAVAALLLAVLVLLIFTR